MAIGKFPGKLTIPVKKYEPRMFMGKEVPEGATHYLVDQDGNYSWLAYLDRYTHNPAFYQDGFWYGLRYDAEVRGPIHKLPKQEPQKSIDMKELTLQDLDDGVIVVMPYNSRYKLHRTNYTIDMSEWCTILNKLKITLEGIQLIIKQPTQEKNPEQIAYDQLQAQIADEETRHNESMKALREQAEKLKPKE